NAGSNGGGAKLRVILARPRIYIMKVSWSGSFRKELEADRFFSSFILSRVGVLQNFDIKKGGPGDFKVQQPPPPEKRGPPPWTPGQPHWRLQLQTPIGMNGLIGYWPLNEHEGPFTRDTSGADRMGQVRGGWWINGIDGKALMLDGPVDTMTVGQEKGRAITFQPRSGLTVACWVATRQADGVVLAMTDSFNTNIKVRLAVKNGLVNGKVWCAHGQPPIDFQASGQARIDDGVWHHIVLMRHDDGSIEIHQDGTPQGRKWPGVNFDPATLKTELLTVGSEGNVFDPGMAPPKSFQFCIDELCVFDRAITPFQIQALAGNPR
ncbi:MAG TPA: LamG-like jellyroll fold domain-containing protein, partial [Gemmataceae bacterium]|nr:LamG-like jellyroll fold domain-containing protein [Gemmataceae bacterium]